MHTQVTATSITTPHHESAKDVLPKQKKGSPSRPGDDRFQPIIRETKNLEKGILHDYKEMGPAREFDTMIREKFQRYA